MASTSTTTENEALARRFPEDIATRGDLKLVDEICAPDVVDHSPFGDLEGREALKAQMSVLREAFSDFSATVEDTVTEGDRVAMRVTLRGTHDGPFMGIEATGKSFEVENTVFSRIEDGQIAERWVLPNMLGMLGQLGIVDAPELSMPPS
ncbi:ester cyclase [Halorarius litoreus]|uniref:ester cyclase n=1 Tax=Halorarius litoreus TaxID=2962676 RepID=UPI0020CC804F|nr:ester cyclase [Halorarius litoreus]